MTRSFILVILSSLAFTSYAGGGWLSGQFHGYFKISQSAIVANKYFAENGDIVDIPTTSYFATSIYGEYGLTSRLEVILYAPMVSRSTMNRIEDNNGQLLLEGDAVTSFGDSDVSLKLGIIKNRPIVVSATLMLGLPIGKAVGGKTGRLQTGDGEFNQMIRIDASRSIGSGYASLFGGFNNRTKGFSDEWRYGIEGGIEMSKWYVIARVFGIKPLNNGDDKFDRSIPGIFSDRIEYLSFTPEIIYNMTDKIGMAASVGFAFYGKRILARPNYGFGVFLKV